MPEDIDEISVKMSLTTEDFVKDVDKAIEAALHRAEDFEQRVTELHNALKQLSEGAEVVFRAAATGEELDQVAERLVRTGEIADKTVQQLVAEAEAASVLLDEITQQTLDSFMEMADAAGILI
jgi:polyhydroxyalkanoate synthesis regulator phasin